MLRSQQQAQKSGLVELTFKLVNLNKMPRHQARHKLQIDRVFMPHLVHKRPNQAQCVFKEFGKSLKSLSNCICIILTGKKNHITTFGSEKKSLNHTATCHE